MTAPAHRIARLPKVLYLLGLIEDPHDKAAVRSKSATFYRRFRHNSEFPEPVDLPDGGLAFWEDEVVTYLEQRGRTDDPRGNIVPLPAHWLRSNQRGNSNPTDNPTPPQAP
jgi:predicted DNA-binding transcriptional regulator AlpA